MSSERAFLFLQGPSSPLFAKIADHLNRAGRACYRINLNVGDQIFWRRGGSFNYRGSFKNWGSYIKSFMEDRNIGTIILLGEERPYHREAVRAAKERGVEVVVIEMGYLRPDWVTVELDGMSSNSRFPNDPDVILRAAENLPEPDWKQKYHQTFWNEAVADLAYYLPTVFLGFLYPRYRVHGIYHPLVEYAGWIVRLATKRRREKVAVSTLRSVHSRPIDLFIYPLQLETDYQLRAHSPYANQREAIVEVVSSFARHAEFSQSLIIKVHPLDNGLVSWEKIINELRTEYKLSDRLIFIDGGDLGQMLSRCVGMVTVNSSAALPAIKKNIPTKVLGISVYDIPGLTEQRSLDEFWSCPTRPDTDLVASFFRLLAASIQVRGNLYSPEGVASSAESIAQKLQSGTLNVPATNCFTPIRGSVKDCSQGDKRSG